jgi:16S rRNA (uracil1498-N3)-methyltransferase
MSPVHARFYAPALEAGAASVRLSNDEGRHLARVLRLREGAAVRVFDGRGRECDGHVARIDGDEVTIDIDGEAAPAPETTARITLAQSVLKGDGMDDVVRDAVMLGAAAIVPVLSARVEGDRRNHAAGLRLARWERIAVASAKQCGRAVVPAIVPPESLAAALAQPGVGLRVVLVEPTAAVPRVGLDELGASPPPKAAALFVGPEGGWADDELRLLAGSDARAVTLGRRTLRAESAAIVGLSMLHTLWREFG